MLIDNITFGNMFTCTSKRIQYAWKKLNHETFDQCTFDNAIHFPLGVNRTYIYKMLYIGK